jgi:hypothetical protein
MRASQWARFFKSFTIFRGLCQELFSIVYRKCIGREHRFFALHTHFAIKSPEAKTLLSWIYSSKTLPVGKFVTKELTGGFRHITFAYMLLKDAKDFAYLPRQQLQERSINGSLID